MSNLSQPPISHLMNEAFTWVEIPNLIMSMPSLLCAETVKPKRVIVLPGFGASDLSTFTLRSYLSSLGHDVQGWRRGTSGVDMLGAVSDVAEYVQNKPDTNGDKIALIGWSMGGIIAREVARENPGFVSQVITMGSPVIGGPKYTLVADAFKRSGHDLDEVETLMAEREAVPIQVPVTVIYSKNDGVVAWEACLDHKTPNVRHVEVRTSHIGFGFSSDVYRHVAARLGD